MFICSLTLFAIGLTFGGVRYSWSSPAVLVPFCIGLAGLTLFPFYEARLEHPTMPVNVFFSNRTMCVTSPPSMVQDRY